MGSKKKKKEEKDHLAPSDLMLGHALCGEEDRGCVLVACAKAERELALLLAAFFRKNGHASQQKISQLIDASNNPQALLGSGWAKANIALAIGLVSPGVYALFDFLRELRNDVAHHDGQIALTEKAVAPLLSYINDDVHGPELKKYLEEYRRGEPFLGYPASKFSEPRISFMYACIILIAALYHCRVQIDPPGYPTGTLLAHWHDGAELHMSFMPVKLDEKDADQPQ